MAGSGKASKSGGSGASHINPPSFPPVAAGGLRRRLTIQQNSKTSDGLLGYTDSWSDLLTTWGSVTAKQSTALLQLIAGQQMAQTAYDIVLRYPPALTILPGMRVVDGGRVYLISNVNDTNERHRVIHLACVQAPAT